MKYATSNPIFIRMSNLLLTIENIESLKELKEFAKKFKIKISALTEDEVLDLGLARAMREADDDDLVDLDKVMDFLSE